MRCCMAWYVAGFCSNLFKRPLAFAGIFNGFSHPPTASVLQPQHGGDVRQHPEQAPAAQTQHFQRGATPAGGTATKRPNQEIGLRRGLCKSKISSFFSICVSYC